MSGKSFVCKRDKRQFASAAALAQHARDAHSAGPKAPRRKGASASSAAPVAAAQKMRVSPPSDAARLSGTDRLISQEITPSLWPNNGEVVYSGLVEPGDFSRLRTVSMAFQKIRWLRLRFRIEPQMNTMTSGGYVAAFLPDAEDDIESVDSLLATRGSVVAKWWQSSVVVANVDSKTWYYTSEGSEVRTYSPGRFVIMVEGSPTQIGNLTVFVEWDVELKTASFESPRRVVKEHTVLLDLYTRNGHRGLFGRIGKGWDDKDFHSEIFDLIDGAEVGDSFILSPGLTVPTPDGTKVRIAHYLHAAARNDLYLAYNSPVDDAKDNYVDANLVLTKGTRLTKYAAAVSGERKAPPSSVSQTVMAALPSTSDASLRRIEQSLEVLLTSLRLSNSPSTDSFQLLLPDKEESL